MALTVRSARPTEALSLLARLYGLSDEEVQPVVESLLYLCVAEDHGESLGVLGLRHPTNCGAEVMGGSLPGSDRHSVSLALLQHALERQPQLVAYGEEDFFSADTLHAAGFRVISAYTKASGPLPTKQVAVPDGYRLVPLSEVHDGHDRYRAQQAYMDQPGHTVTTTADVVPNVHGSDDRLGFLAYDAAGQPAGVVRAWLDKGELSVGNPGVHLAHRMTGLRQSLLLAACGAARQRGATRLVMESWGETAEDRTADEQLGLQLETSTPIYGSLHVDRMAMAQQEGGPILSDHTA
ncbi:hypothetical protein [Deinococcus arboris]|uniref:hypothetical protein n=1 Tax=Deinococcus arboris TaxID=2682977 RepID=UPI0018DBA343|nr:hypothetical protein [Deinococcus arboris]